MQRGLVGQAEDLLTEATSWQMPTRHGLAAVQRSVAAVEQTARRKRWFEVAIVPGLLQTAEYMRQVFMALGRGGEREVTEAVAARLDRQRLLYDPDRTFEILVDENVLRMTFGSHRLMRQQADHIASLSTLENLTVGVIPLDTALPVIPLHGFAIYDDRLVDVETQSAQLEVHGRADIAVYERSFETLRGHALLGDDARDLLHQIAAHHHRLTGG